MSSARLLGSVCVIAIATAGMAACRSGPAAPGATAASARAPSARPGAGTGYEDKTPSDAEIAEAVRRELAQDTTTAGSEIRVESAGGVIDLTGVAETVIVKERAAAHAEVVKGVRAVTNHLTVRPAKTQDADLEKAVADALVANAAADGYEIAAKVERGVVTLTGTVHSHQERRLAEHLAKGTSGVVDVKDAIVVEHTAIRPDPEIARDVQARLRWDALVDDGLVVVSVKDRVVKLAGTVGSAAERSRATWDAWIAGVDAVDSSALEVKWWAREGALRKDKYTPKAGKDIEQAIRDAARLDPRVESLDLRPVVSGGVATLRGTVATAAAKLAAEELARHTVGVLSVDNQLAVKPPTPVPDSEIARAAKAALRAHGYDGARRIDVRVRSGTAVLSGSVRSEADGAAAAAAVAGLRGVRSVENDLYVEEPATPFVYDPYVYPNDPSLASWQLGPRIPLFSDQEIAKRIRAELFWSPFVSADAVQVQVHNGRATLTGTVDTVRERDVAADNALEGGATGVDNRLQIR